MKKNKLISIILIIYIVLLSFNKYIKIFSIPLFCFPMFFLFIYVIIQIMKNWKIDKTTIFLLLWGIYAVILMIMNYNITSLKSTTALITNIITFIVINRLTNQNFEYIKDCIKGMKIALIINLLAAVWEIITKSHIMILTQEYSRRFFGIPLTFYANANDLSVIMVSFIAILLIDIIINKSNEKSFINKAFTGLLIISSYYIIIKTNSLIGKVAFPAIISLTIFIKLYYRRKSKAILIILIALIIILIYIATGNIMQMKENESFSSRIVIWKSVVNLFIKSNGTGIGPGQNEVIGVGQVHCLPLEILSEYGIFVFFLFTTIYIQGIICAKNNIILMQKEKDMSIISCIILAFLLILIALSISTSSMTKLYITWGVISICYAILKNIKEVNK